MFHHLWMFPGALSLSTCGPVRPQQSPADLCSMERCLGKPPHIFRVGFPELHHQARDHLVQEEQDVFWLSLQNSALVCHHWEHICLNMLKIYTSVKTLVYDTNENIILFWKFKKKIGRKRNLNSHGNVFSVKKKNFGNFIVKIRTGNRLPLSLVLAGVARTDQETSAPLGETAPDCMVENRFIILPFSGDRLYD